MAVPRMSSGRPDKNPGFLPKRIIALDADGKSRHFRWSMNRFGQIRVVQQSEMTPFAKGQKCVVCIDPKLMFRRRCNLSVQTREELNRVARDFFPFADNDIITFAYTPPDGLPDGLDATNEGELPDGGLILALPEQDWQAMQKNIPVPAAAILAAEANSSSVQTVLEKRFASGALSDLIHSPARLIAPSILAFGIWIAALAAILLVGFGLWRFQNNWQIAKLSGEIAALESEVSITKQRYESMQLMRDTLMDYQSFQAAENKGFQEILTQLVATLPQGVSIDRIEFKDGKLSISGLGRDPKDWLAPFGVAASDIEITPLPQYNRYVAIINLPGQQSKQPLRP